jgi:hypothetical protein
MLTVLTQNPALLGAYAPTRAFVRGSEGGGEHWALQPRPRCGNCLVREPNIPLT